MRRLRFVLALAIAAVSPGLLTGQADPPALLQAAGPYSIGGVVVSAADGRPLNRCHVTLAVAATGSAIAETTTGEDGRFLFAHLAATKYGLLASRRGYITAAYDEHPPYSTAIVTGEGLVSTGLSYRLAPQAMIFGTVTDDSGDPVQQASVSVFRQNGRSGLGNIVRVQTVVSDDTGAYEITRLAPGDYFLAVTAKPWYATHLQPSRDAQGKPGAEPPQSPLDVAYARTFYADVTDSGSATPIPVKAGDRVPVNFSLHPLPAVHITVELPPHGEGQTTNPGQFMPQFRQDVFGSEEPVNAQFSGINPGVGGSPSSLAVYGVAPGDYQVEMRAPQGAAGRFANLRATGNMKLDASQAVPMANVSGKFAMADGEKLPPGMAVSLRSEQAENAPGARVDADGSFDLKGVAPGDYELLVYGVNNGMNKVFAPTRVAAAGAAVEGHTVKVGSEAVILAATLIEGSLNLGGFATRNRKPAAGAMIVLVPKDPVADHDMFRRDQSDSDGSFTLSRVIPGEYTLVAIQDGWTLDWARPAVIAHYVSRGQKVSVPVHASKDLTLPVPVEVQPK